ncbi:unnamed protein product [Durusdinium trenchii]|uniref:Uncharacterized protein n=2 Tax=Durusdinium trenchii TaxID=1381693 RepID=A0ABP0QDW1_9DINO
MFGCQSCLSSRLSLCSFRALPLTSQQAGHWSQRHTSQDTLWQRWVSSISGLTTLSSEQPSDLATSTPQRPSFGHGDTCGLECARVAGSHCQSCSWRDRRAKAHMHDIRKNDVLVIVCHEELWSQEIGLSCMS